MSCIYLISFLSRASTLAIFFFFFNDTATTEIYTLSLHDALPISLRPPTSREALGHPGTRGGSRATRASARQRPRGPRPRSPAAARAALLARPGPRTAAPARRRTPAREPRPPLPSDRSRETHS